MNRCCTCSWCHVVSRTQGNCHGAPPQAFHAQLLKCNGEWPPKIDPREGEWVQLFPSNPSAIWPPIDPSRPGCRLHRLSIRTWLAWLKAPHSIKIEAVEQRRS